MTYKVYTKLENHFIEDYTIIIFETDDRTTYKLQHTGETWCDEYQGKICLEVENTGDGYKFNKICKDMGYDKASQLLILMKFINWYEKQYNNSCLYEGEIRETIQTQTITI